VTVVATFLDNIAEEHITWRWQGRIAAGKVTVGEGDPGLGKTTVGLEIAARLSRGGRLPGELINSPELIVGIISDEDGLRDTTIPRLAIANAKMENICQLTGQTKDGHKRSLMIPEDTNEIIKLVRQLKIKHLYVDPLAAHAGPSVNLYIDQDVRAKVMGPLAVVGEETGASIWLTRHPNKQVGAAAMYRGGGSLGIIGAARFGLAFVRDPQDHDRIVMAPVKFNIGPMPSSLAFRLESVEGSDHARVRWDREPCYLTADDILIAPPSQSAKATTAAGQWLLELLVPGPQLVSAVQAAAEEAGHKWGTVERAKRELNVASKRVGFGEGSAVYWLLPGQKAPEPTPTDDDPHTLQNPSPLRTSKPMTPMEANGHTPHTPSYASRETKPMEMYAGSPHTPHRLHASTEGDALKPIGSDERYTCLRKGCEKPAGKYSYCSPDCEAEDKAA
jgi:hypothetical protein